MIRHTLGWLADLALAYVSLTVLLIIAYFFVTPRLDVRGGCARGGGLRLPTAAAASQT